MRPRHMLPVALALTLAGCGAVSGPAPSPTPPPDGALVVGSMSPSCPSQSGGEKHYPPTERRTYTVEETWTRPAEACELAANNTRRGVDLTDAGRVEAIGWTGEYIDVEERWDPVRHRAFEAADGSEYAVVVLGYGNRTVLETFHVAGYC